MLMILCGKCIALISLDKRTLFAGWREAGLATLQLEPEATGNNMAEHKANGY